MNLKLEILLLILGGFFRILGVGFNAWYYFRQTFSSDLMQYACACFLLAPSFIFFLLSVVFFTLDSIKGNFKIALFKLSLGLLITIGGPLGIPLFVYAGLLSCTESNTGDFHIIDAIARGTSLIEALFESLPQIFIQMFNNISMNNWSDPFKVLPICFSCLSLIYTIYKLCYSLDKMQQYETAVVSFTPRPDVSDIRSASDVNLNKSQTQVTGRSLKKSHTQLTNKSLRKSDTQIISFKSEKNGVYDSQDEF